MTEIVVRSTAIKAKMKDFDEFIAQKEVVLKDVGVALPFWWDAGPLLCERRFIDEDERRMFDGWQLGYELVSGEWRIAVRTVRQGADDADDVKTLPLSLSDAPLRVRVAAGECITAFFEALAMEMAHFQQVQLPSDPERRGTDDGRYIDHEIMRRIFDAFLRGESSESICTELNRLAGLRLADTFPHPMGGES